MIQDLYEKTKFMIFLKMINVMYLFIIYVFINVAFNIGMFRLHINAEDLIYLFSDFRGNQLPHKK